PAPPASPTRRSSDPAHDRRRNLREPGPKHLEDPARLVHERLGRVLQIAGGRFPVGTDDRPIRPEETGTDPSAPDIDGQDGLSGADRKSTRLNSSHVS